MTEALITPAELEARRRLFDQCFNRLAKATRATDVDAATKRIYFDALADLPTWAIEDAELYLRRTKTFFPSSGEWHQAGRTVVEARRKDLIAQPTREEVCTTCRDTGWVEISDLAGRDGFVPCSCRPTNENYIRMTASSRKGVNEEVK